MERDLPIQEQPNAGLHRAHGRRPDLVPDVQAQQVVTLVPAGDRQEEAAAAAPHIHYEGPVCVWVDGRPIWRCQRHLKLLLQWVDMLAAPHCLCLCKAAEGLDTCTSCGRGALVACASVQSIRESPYEVHSNSWSNMHLPIHCLVERKIWPRFCLLQKLAALQRRLGKDMSGVSLVQRNKRRQEGKEECCHSIATHRSR